MKAYSFLCLVVTGVAFAYATASAQTTRSQTPASTTTAEGQHRQSSSANGTSINNSNSTNYNSNNVTNAPTGVGSNPSVSTNPTTLNDTATHDTSAPSPKTGTAAAVTKARTAPTPAVVAGSTVRNTSIHDYVASSPNYTTLQNALQVAQLYNSLKEGGPYTLFAPSNSAFKKLPASVQAGMLEGRNQDMLKQLLSYHLVDGQLDREELMKRVRTNKGKVSIQTVSGGSLLVQRRGTGELTLTSESGQTVVINSSEQHQLNGIVYGIDNVLLPKNAARTIH